MISSAGLRAVEGPGVRTAALAQLCGRDYRISLFLSSLQPYLWDVWTVAFMLSHFLAPFSPCLLFMYSTVQYMNKLHAESSLDTSEGERQSEVVFPRLPPAAAEYISSAHFAESTSRGTGEVGGLCNGLSFIFILWNAVFCSPAKKIKNSKLKALRDRQDLKKCREYSIYNSHKLFIV